MIHAARLRLGRWVIPPAAAFAFVVAWIFKLYYDTSPYRREPLFALLFWPSALIAASLGALAVYVWLPERWRDWIVARRWTTLASRTACAVVAASAATAFGRILIFIQRDNWWFDSVWGYAPNVGLIFVAVPLPFLFAALGLWPRKSEVPRDLWIIAFALTSLFVLWKLWAFLDVVGCDSCSGPLG